MNWARLCELGRGLPEVSAGVGYRTPSLQVRKKSFVRWKEDGRTVVFLLDSVDEQEFLIENRADVDFITDHYRGHASVLARLSKLRVDEARQRLERAWRRKAPVTLVRKVDR